MSADRLDGVRAVADAVLYEGYLLYPYRASSSKNRSRWQFGVLGPPRASADSFPEEPEMSVQCLLERGPGDPATQWPRVRILLRFLHVQERTVERLEDGALVPTDELVVDGRSLLSWQEAVEVELSPPAYDLVTAFDGDTGLRVISTFDVPGDEETEPVRDHRGTTVGRIVRRRRPLTAAVDVVAEPDDGYARLTVRVRNAHPDEATTKDDAVRLSLVGAHLVLTAEQAGFVSLLDPADDVADAVSRCHQRRCFPVLAGPAGSRDTVLGSPIILYDHPEVAAESTGALFDSTEIDEILTLRVMTLTDAEKAEARATDPRAAEIIDRCDAMSTEDLQQLHGTRRDPGTTTPVAGRPDDVPWWDPAADESVRPAVDHVVVDGVEISRGSLVRVHPSRRADAQDLFFADRVARVTAVLSDVDGGTHVALVLVDDPAADLHDWYGRYLYFAPDELEPLDPAREESRS